MNKMKQTALMLLLFLAWNFSGLVAQTPPTPPEPGPSDGPPGPPGFPIDQSLWWLFAAGLILGIFLVYRRIKNHQDLSS